MNFDFTVLTSSWGKKCQVLMAGALLPLAFAPFDLTLFAIASPAVLFAIWLSDTPRQAMTHGYLFGLGQFGSGVSWVYVSINEFGHTGIIVASLLTLSFIAVLALFPLLVGYIVRRIRGRDTIMLLLSMPALWTLGEWTRGWFLTGFSWLHLGYSQTDTWLSAYAPVGGVYLVSWVVAMLAGLLVLLLKHRRRHGIQVVLLTGLLISGGFVLQTVNWVSNAGDALKVSLIQGNISQHHKWRRNQRVPTLSLYRRLTEQHLQSDIIIWPETAIPAWFHSVKDDYLKELTSIAVDSKTSIITGIAVTNLETKDYFNSLIAIDSSNPEIQFYHKDHLVPFGEYVPLESWLRGLIGFFDLPMSSFSRGGQQQTLISVAGQKISSSICYEIAFGEEVIKALPEASMLVNISNDAWFGGTLAPYQHLQIARMRSIETGRPLLRSTNTGISAIIDHRGKIQQFAPPDKRLVISGSVYPQQGATPYVRVGNMFVIVFMLLLILVADIFSGRRQPESG